MGRWINGWVDGENTEDEKYEEEEEEEEEEKEEEERRRRWERGYISVCFCQALLLRR